MKNVFVTSVKICSLIIALISIGWENSGHRGTFRVLFANDFPHVEQIAMDTRVVDDNTKLSAADYRDMLYRDINNRRKEARRAEQARQVAGRATAFVDKNIA